MKKMKSCFVIMPIGSGDVHEIHLNRYDNIIRPAVEGFILNGEQAFDVKRADFISRTGSINKKVIQNIYKADVVIADLTDLNPNVFYELGVRHSLRNGTILIALEGTKIPFDVQDLNVIFYKDRVGGEKKVIPEIQEFLNELLCNERVEDSPVFSILPELTSSPAYDLIDSRARVSQLESVVGELQEKLKVAEAVNLSLRDSFNTYEQTIATVLAKLDPQEQAKAAQEVDIAAKNKTRAKIKKVDISDEIDEDPSFAFVVMPFKEEMKPVFDNIRFTVTKLGLDVMRADTIQASGRIMDQIWRSIGRAGIIIADITDSNPNVMFEVGIAMSLGKKMIMISQKKGAIPFDVAAFRIIFYENTLIGMDLLREQLENALKNIIM